MTRGKGLISRAVRRTLPAARTISDVGKGDLTHRFENRCLWRVEVEEPHAATEDLFALKRAQIIDRLESAARTGREAS